MDRVFTSHNIRLDDGEQTLPTAGFSMEKNPMLVAALRTLNLVFPGGLAGRSIADLGCLEGGFATEFARAGMTVTGFEVRDSNIQNCEYVKSKVDLPNLRFVQDDVMNIGNYGPFDALFVAGLLYHLDRPRQFLEEATRVCRKVIILETHVGPAQHEAAVDLYKLTPTDLNEGLRGRWFSEYGDVSSETLDRMRWSSWSNNRSFWIEKPSLLQALTELGFDHVLEQFDCETDIETQYTTGFRRTNARVFLVGIKSGVATA